MESKNFRIGRPPRLAALRNRGGESPDSFLFVLTAAGRQVALYPDAVFRIVRNLAVGHARYSFEYFIITRAAAEVPGEGLLWKDYTSSEADTSSAWPQYREADVPFCLQSKKA